MIREALFAMIATAGFAVFTNLGWHSVFFAGLGAGIGWLSYQLFLNLLGAKVLSLFLAAVVGALYSEVVAKILRKPATIFTLCAIVAMVPGTGMYYTMISSITGTVAETMNYAIQTFLAAGAIAAGMAFVTSLGMVSRHVRRQKRPPDETVRDVRQGTKL